PLIGQALCAGFPGPAAQFQQAPLPVPRLRVPHPPATFLGRAARSALGGAGIYGRDLACVDRRPQPSHRGGVVAAIDAQMSSQRLVIDGNVARLAFCSPDLPAFAIDEL
ncbi:peptidase S24, partial [Methylobacterium sp. E-066]|uniref:peptidase S24 n=1 Tax=Methylobacterium sp. E-066 TaxID=2836584 RepID=UPI001FBB25DC